MLSEPAGSDQWHLSDAVDKYKDSVQPYRKERMFLLTNSIGECSAGKEWMFILRITWLTHIDYVAKMQSVNLKPLYTGRKHWAIKCCTWPHPLTNGFITPVAAWVMILPRSDSIRWMSGFVGYDVNYIKSQSVYASYNWCHFHLVVRIFVNKL
jgi:hypothetical protein